MAKPTSTPGWSATGVEPAAGKKSAGFAGGEKPPDDFFDWFWTSVSEWIDYLDAGLIQHDEKTLTLPAQAGMSDQHDTVYDANNTTAGGVVCVINSGSDEWHIPVPLDVGKRIKEIRGYVTDNATGTTTVTMELIENTLDSTAVNPIDDATSDGSGSDQTLSLTGLTTTITAGKAYYVRFVASSANPVTIYGLEIDYDQVA